MKKAGIFAAVIALVLLFMQLYNYRLLAYTDDTCYVIDGKLAADKLKNGVEEGEDPNIALEKYEAATPVYTRSSKWFIGEDYRPLDTSFPVYVNEGNFLYSFSDEMQLVTSEFSVLDTYEGIYVAEGKTYNRDREQADPDEFIFVAAGDGLYLNAQTMTVRSSARTQSIGANSLMNLEEDKISYYSFEKGMYIYEEYRDLLYATVEIGSVSMTYEELLGRLKDISGKDREEQRSAEETKAESPKETNPENETEAAFEEAQVESLAESTEADLESGQPEKAEKEKEERKPSEKQPKNPIEPTDPDHPPRPGRTLDWPFEGDMDEDGQNEDNGGSGSQGQGNQGGGDQGDTGDGDQEGGGSQGGGEEQQAKPEVSLSKFQFGVYHGETFLTINDPNHTIVKGVRVIIYKKGETRASYRKLFRAGGEVVLEPLEPDTEYEAEGYFDYIDPVSGKQREVFFQRQYVGKTLPISALTPLEVFQRPEDEEFFPYAIQINDFTVKNEKTEGGATPSEAEKKYEALPYIASVQLSFEKQGMPEWNSPHTSISSSLLSAVKRGEAVTWKTEDILDSYSKYKYSLTFYDRFGNQLPVSKTSATGGETRTSKIAPEAVMSIDQESDVKTLKMKLEISNKDKAEFVKNGQKVRPYLYITYADKPDVPISFTLEGESQEITRYELKKDSEKLIFTSLLPSTGYTVWVKGSFDLEDGKVHEDQVMGSIFTTTDSLSSLGTVNFLFMSDNITSSSGTLTVETRSAVSENLYPFLSQVDISLSSGGQQTFYRQFKKADLDEIQMNPGDDYTVPADSQGLSGPEIVIHLPLDSQPMSPWRALLTNGTAAIDFKEGSLNSATKYNVEAKAYAVRGSNDGDKVVQEDVTGRYYRSSFQTLKKKVYVDYEMSFINASSATFYNPRVIDQDGAVIGGNVTVRLKRKSNGVVVDVRAFQNSELNSLDYITFSGLDGNTEYILEFVAQEYNEGYSSVTKEMQKTLYLKDGSQIIFKAENTLWGSLTPDSLTQDYEEQTGKQGVGISSINIFDVNEAEMSIKVTAQGEEYNSGVAASEYIPVEEGQVYLAGGGIDAAIYCYDEDKNYIKYVSDGNRASLTGVFTVPQDCAYIRVNVNTANLASSFISPALFAEQDSAADLLKGKEATEEAYINSDGITIIKNAGAKNFACIEDYIPISPEKRYFRIKSGKTTTDWRARRIFYYDKEKNFLKAVDGDSDGYTVVPPDGAAYVRLNLAADSKEEIFFGEESLLLYGKDVLEGATWHEGMYVNALNRFDNTTYSYQMYCDYIPVKPSAVYWAQNLRGIQIFTKDKKFLGFYDAGSYSIKIPADGAYIRANAEFGENHDAVFYFRQISPQLKRGELTIGMDLELEDSNSSLGSDPSFTLVYTERDQEGNETTWEEVKKIADFSGRRYTEAIYFQAEPDCEYQVDLVVDMGGRRIILDSAAVGTDKVANIIKSEAALRAVRYAPAEDYIVTRDIEVKSNNIIYRFYGNLDFQGHTITMDNVINLFYNIYDGAVVENLVVNSKLDSPNLTVGNGSAVCYQNRGIIRDTVLKISLDNQRDNTSFGGLTLYNYGSLENFALQLTGDFCIQSYGAVAAAYNNGVIKNGYLVSEDAYRIKACLNQTGSRTSRGGIVGNNRGGSVENVYAAVVVEDQYTPGSSAKDTTEQMGMIAGVTRGTVKNAFGVGMTLTNDVPASVNGPSVGYVATQGGVGNISYIETMNFQNPRYANRFNNQVTTASLWDKEWLASAINQDDAFDLEIAAGGYYPQVKMSEEMEGKQPLVHLPDQFKPSAPKIISTAVLEQENDRALVQFGLENRSNLEIKEFNIAVMNMKSNQRTYEPDAVKAEVKEQGIKEDGTYYVNVEMTEPVFFRSKYYVYSLRAGLAQNESTDAWYEDSDREKSEISMEFYKPVETVEDWRNSFGKAIDAYGNYRIQAQELDFWNIKTSDYLTNYRIIGSFYGKIDGQWTDEQGVSHTALLKNINMDGSPSLIENLYGSLKNIMVDGLSVDSEHRGDIINKGLIGYSSGGKVENVHVRNAKVSGAYNTGGLIGYATDSSEIKNCSVSDSQIITYASKVSGKVSVGGLIGRMSTSDLENSYVQDVDIDNTKALDTEGAGGIAGITNGDQVIIKNCYAAGALKSVYRNIGGLVGSQTAGDFRMTGSFSKVDMDIYGSYVGGLLGYLNQFEEIKGNISLGNIFVHSSTPTMVHRIAGYGITQKYEGNYGFSGQMYLNETMSGDIDDTSALLAGADLRSEATYKDLLGWDESNYAFQWSGEEGKQGILDSCLPMLKGADGSLLPWQKPIQIITEDTGLSVVEFAINNSAVKEYAAMFPGQTAPFSQAYSLRLDLSYDQSKYFIASVSAEGLNLNEKMNETITYKDQPITGTNRVIRTYPFVLDEMGGDVYCINVVLQGIEDSGKQVTLSAVAKPSVPINMTIKNAQEWNAVMEKYGDSFGNFVLTGDIDAKTLPAGTELIDDVRINSLSSMGGQTFAIKNITHRADSRSNALISNCLSRIENVNFENISWKVPEKDQDGRLSSYENIGLVGLNQGTIENVGFSNIEIDGGKGTRTGCIAYNTGNLTDIKLKDIKVSSEGSYTGGLTGYTQLEVNRITAEGDLKASQSGQDSTEYESTYEITGRFYVGGIIGSGRVCDSVRVSGIRVMGDDFGTGETVSQIGGIVGNGNVPQAGDSPTENEEKYSSIVNSVIETKDTIAKAEYIGGAAGNGSVYHVKAENLVVRSQKGTKVGGLNGQAYSYKSSLTTLDNGAYEVKQSEITGEEFVGGVSGRGYTSSVTVSRTRIQALKAYAGGITGVNYSSNSSDLADSVWVKAPQGAGGISGSVENGDISSCLVSRSQIEGTCNVGGIMGEARTNAVSYTGNGVINSTITAGKNADTNESNAGGIGGYLELLNNFSNNYVKDTKIFAEGSCAGGLIGASMGGHYFRNVSAATVEAQDSAAGGFIGKLTGYQKNISTDYAKVKLYESYSASKVKAADYGAGFIGMYTCSPDTQLYALNEENTYGLLSMGTVSSGDHSDLFINTDENRSGLSWSGGYLRAYAGAALERGGTSKTADAIYEYSWDQAKPSGAGGTAEAGNQLLKEILTVTGKNLMDKRLYTNGFSEGGMNWGSGNWIYDGLGRMDEDKEAENKAKGTTNIMITANGTTETVIGQDTGLYTVAKGFTPVGEMLEDGTEYQWYRAYEPNRGSSFVVNGATGRSLEMAGRGYYFGRIRIGSTYFYTSTIKVDTEGYMPYINGGNTNTKGGQEGILPEVGEDDELKLYNGTDRLFYGGIVIPDESNTVTFAALGDGDAAAEAYPSGPDCVNVELRKDFEAADRLQVTAGDQTLLDVRPDRRVYTLNYDYKSVLNITVKAGEEERTYSYDPTLLRRTVMVWEDDYYYTSGGSLKNSSGTVTDEEIIHLYGGMALGADGAVYDVAAGEKVSDSKRETWKSEDGRLPVSQADYKGSRIKTYGRFSEIATASEAQEATVREQQLFVKDGSMFGLESSQWSKGFVIDQYNGQTFVAALNEKQELKDFADPLKTPENFSRKNVAHMSNTLDTNQPYLLVRYATGEAKGFNYLTGEELPIENAYSDISLFDFAADFMNDFIDQADQGNQAFVDLKLLKEDLMLNPVTDEQLEAAMAVISNQTDSETLDSDEEAADEENEPEAEADSENKSEEKEKEEEADSENLSDKNREDIQGEYVDGSGQINGDADSDGDGEGDGAEDVNGSSLLKGQPAPDQEAGELKQEDSQKEHAESLNKPESEKKPVNNSQKSKKKAEADNKKSEKPEADSEPKEISEASGSGGGQAENSQAGNSQAGNLSEEDYVYSFNTDEEICQLYSSSDLLTESENQLMSQEKKLETLKAAGMLVDEKHLMGKARTEKESKGLIIFAVTAAAALGLSGILIRRRRK